MACIFRENLPSEVQAFRKDVWPEEPIYLDHQYQFFAALGGGKLPEVPMEYWIKNSKTPSDEFKAKMAKSLALAEGYMTPDHHNLIGQGLMTGGVYVMRKGGEVEFAHAEGFPGHTADPADIVAAASRAAGASSKL